MNQPATCSQKSKGKRFTNTIFSNIFLSLRRALGGKTASACEIDDWAPHHLLGGVICLNGHDAWKKFRKMFRFLKTGSLVVTNPIGRKSGKKHHQKKTPSILRRKCSPPKGMQALPTFGQHFPIDLAWRQHQELVKHTAKRPRIAIIRLKYSAQRLLGFCWLQEVGSFGV